MPDTSKNVSVLQTPSSQCTISFAEPSPLVGFILSLAYSVYTAASIFLLQVQAANGLNDQAVRRLMFCITALDRVKESTPILNDALGLLNRELRAAGVSPETFAPLSSTTYLACSLLTTTRQSHQDVSHVMPLDQPSTQDLEDFDFSDIEIEPSIFDAFSLLEPISVNVGALDILEGYHHG